MNSSQINDTKLKRKKKNQIKRKKTERSLDLVFKCSQSFVVASFCIT